MGLRSWFRKGEKPTAGAGDAYLQLSDDQLFTKAAEVIAWEPTRSGAAALLLGKHPEHNGVVSELSRRKHVKLVTSQTLDGAAVTAVAPELLAKIRANPAYVAKETKLQQQLDSVLSGLIEQASYMIGWQSDLHGGYRIATVDRARHDQPLVSPKESSILSALAVARVVQLSMDDNETGYATTDKRLVAAIESRQGKSAFSAQRDEVPVTGERHR